MGLVSNLADKISYDNFQIYPFTKKFFFAKNVPLFLIQGVPDALEKHKDDVNTESKGIKAHFNLDDSGLLHVTGIESVFEKTTTVEEQEKAEAERVAKGQLISECILDFFKFSKKPTKKLTNFCLRI